MLFAALPGCSQHGCYTEAPLLPRQDAVSNLSEHPPEALECEAGACPTVSTVLNPEASQRAISLQECIALALEKGRIGGTSIRVLAYDPAIVYTAIEESLSRFDTRWFTSMGWSALDERAGNVLSAVPLGLAPLSVPSAIGGVSSAVGAAGVGAINNLVGVNSVSAASFESKLEKLLPTGGLAGITFKTDYTLVNQPPPLIGELNPTYRPRLIFSAEQPLLRGAGTTVNHVPILIARLTFDQEREKFCSAVNQLLFAVEQAYWDLYFSYWNLYTLDEPLRNVQKAWQNALAKEKAGEITIQARALLELQFQNLRRARLEALGGSGRSVLEAERKLRFVVGFPPEDGCRLIPTDTPTTALYVPDCQTAWPAALAAALENRPELSQLRQEVKKIQLDMKRVKNLTLPDLRAVGSYDINGLGTRLDGPGPDNAFRSLASNHFNNWALGLTLDVPIGFRSANSQLRRAGLQLAQRMIQLRDMEKQATFALQQSYRELVQAYQAVEIQKGIRKAAAERQAALKKQADRFQEKPQAVPPLEFEKAQADWLIALEDLIKATSAEQGSIFAYNIAIAKFELDKGTIQQFDNVSISDGPLPVCAQGRASAHVSERQRAVVLRQHPTSTNGHGEPGCAAHSPVVAATAGEGPPPIPSLRMEQGLSADGRELPAAGNAPPDAPWDGAAGTPLHLPRTVPQALPDGR